MNKALIGSFAVSLVCHGFLWLAWPEKPVRPQSHWNVLQGATPVQLSMQTIKPPRPKIALKPLPRLSSIQEQRTIELPAYPLSEWPQEPVALPASVPKQDFPKEEVSEENVTNEQEDLLEEMPSTQGGVTQKAVGVVKSIPPTYPRIAREQGLEGVVFVQVSVNDRGGIDQVELVQSSGYDILDQEALRAIRQWHFEPAWKDGKAVSGLAHIPVRFQLNSAT